MKERKETRKGKKNKNIITSQFNPEWCLSCFKGHVGSKFIDFKTLV